jgi:hypothetical protein
MNKNCRFCSSTITAFKIFFSFKNKIFDEALNVKTRTKLTVCELDQYGINRIFLNDC